MKILILSSVYPTEETLNDIKTTKVVHYFAREWQKMGHDILVIHNAHKYPFVHSLSEGLRNRISTKINFVIAPRDSVKEDHYYVEGINTYRLPMTKFIPHGDHPAGVIRRQVRKICGVLTKESFQPDIIIGHWASPQIQLMYYLKDIYHCRTSLVLHGREYADSPSFDFKKYMQKVDVIGCRCITDALWLKELLGMDKVPFVCYSGIPDKFFEGKAFNGEKFRNIATHRFLYVGRLVEYKNVDTILRALAQLHIDNFVFDIIGDGYEEGNLKQLSKELGIGDKVVFHGKCSREEVMKMTDEADYFVMVSRNEIFGLVYLEAMSGSCIAIGSKKQGIDGIINDGDNGFLCEPGDVRELTEKLKYVLALDPEEKQRFARKGFDTALEFTDSKVAARYLDNVTEQ